jgi:Zn-dependent peptidase ImmA (M78 family)
MAVSRPRYGWIERLTRELVASHRVRRPPVPIDDIVRSRGVEIRYGKLDDISGLIVREGTRTFLGVNRNHPVTRQRFTLAHEFGHFLLHAGSSWYDKEYRINLRSEKSSRAEDIEEIEANFFAASILMPRELLAKDTAERYIDLENADAVKDLARLYNVSTQAMNIRLLNLFGRQGALVRF